MRDPETIETELMEISAIADDLVKFERIVTWCATHPDEIPFCFDYSAARIKLLSLRLTSLERLQWSEIDLSACERHGRLDGQGAHLNNIVQSCSGSEYETEARAWLAKPSGTFVDHNCTGCHISKKAAR